MQSAAERVERQEAVNAALGVGGAGPVRVAIRARRLGSTPTPTLTPHTTHISAAAPIAAPGSGLGSDDQGDAMVTMNLAEILTRSRSA